MNKHIVSIVLAVLAVLAGLYGLYLGVGQAHAYQEGSYYFLVGIFLGLALHIVQGYVLEVRRKRAQTS